MMVFGMRTDPCRRTLATTATTRLKVTTALWELIWFLLQ